MDKRDSRRHIIREAAITAGKFIKTAEPQAGITQKQGRGNFVTAADLASEKIIIDLIKKHFPQDQILSEESAHNLSDILSIDNLWIIDPIDGTNNFVNQRNYSCVSIGYAEKGISQLGAIYNPFVAELFFAEKGKGAFLNDKKMHVEKKTELSKAYVSTDNTYSPEITKRHIELLLAIKPTPWVGIKGSAALAMCEVAAGRMDLYFHSSIHPWDEAAALLLLQEAGGVSKNFNGKTITFDSPDVVVGNEILVNEFIRLISSEKNKTSLKI
jgi:myo-inositol-1(or 4)-monophosphatase